MKTSISQSRLLPLFAVAGLMLAACDKAGPGPTAERRTTDAPAAERRATDTTVAATDKVADPMITTSVNAALAADSKLSATRIDVDTKDGVVTLKGPAPDEAARMRAAELASKTKGVKKVENQLKVQGKS